MAQTFFKWRLAALLLALALVVGCARERGVEPGPEHSNIYVGGETNGVIYVLDGATLAITDSLTGIGLTRWTVPSPDGRWLYVQREYEDAGGSGRFSKIDLLTKEEVIGVDEGLGHPVLLRSGTLMLTGRYPDYFFVDPVTLTEIASLPDSLRYQQVAKAGTKLPVEVAYRNCYRLYDVETGELSGGYVPHLLTGETLQVSWSYGVLHQDERRLLLINELGSQAWRFGGRQAVFLIGDMLTGETLLQYILYFPFGAIAVSTDGAYAAVSDPGDFGPQERSPITVDVFDLRTLQHLRRFGPAQGDDLEVAVLVKFVPNDTRVVVAPWSSVYWLLGPGPLQVLNVGTLALEETLREPFESVGVSSLDAGPRP